VNKYLDNENEIDVDILLKKVNEIHKEKYLSDREISVNVYESSKYKILVINLDFFKKI
jgi:hypothetical protein